MRKLTTEEFVAKAKVLHDGYDYSHTEYINAASPITAVCDKGHTFTQKASTHLSGHGCPYCAGHIRMTTEDFIKRAQEVHGSKYGYESVVYKNSYTKVVIKCRQHGSFEQLPFVHLKQGSGCPYCNKENHKSLRYGVGINDVEDDVRSDAYNTWAGMLDRCCSGRSRYTTYKDCIVCEEWLIYSNFRRWFNNTKNGYKKGFHLDKDILVKGNKVYSPTTCCFVPPHLNEIIVNNKSARGEYPLGVRLTKARRYAAYIYRNGKQRHLGVFDTLGEAFAAYKSAKEAYIKEIATEYFSRGEITKYVYNALMRYEVEITD